MVGRETARQLVAKCLVWEGRKPQGSSEQPKGVQWNLTWKGVNAQGGDRIGGLCLM